MKARFSAKFFLFVLMLVTIAPPVVWSMEFSKKELNLLGKGKTVRRQNPISENGRRLSGSGWAYVNAPIDTVWKSIQDWPSYTRCYPNTVETTEVSRKGSRSLIRMRLGHPLVQVTYHLEMTKLPGKKVIRFKMVKNHHSDLDEIGGYWQLIAVGDNKTLVGYVIDVTAPVGIVNILPDSFKRIAINGILGIPGHLKICVEKKKASRSSSNASSNKAPTKKK